MFSIYAAANSCKRAGYQNIDEIERLEQLDRPGLAAVCMIFWFVLVLLFRLGWLIFGFVCVEFTIFCLLFFEVRWRLSVHLPHLVR